MDMRQLRYFLAIVDHGSVHRAAQELFVAQPSVSQALRSLERDLGTDLFHRTGRKLVLTPAGERLIDPAREVLRGVELARATVEAVNPHRPPPPANSTRNPSTLTGRSHTNTQCPQWPTPTSTPATIGRARAAANALQGTHTSQNWERQANAAAARSSEIDIWWPCG
ncbi:LysR family transcriptional regulator [Actinophytocola sp.]|uniref:LysR family transcriptional regulator n=1 Tax=Actinophytocola sp. TaxID=1872138 RepID=UPI002ED6B907